jgi:hypothetical protein
MNYYDGTKLLSLLDLNNKRPEIYMVTSNRTGGKTTYFGKLVVNKFLSKGEKFGLLYRYDYELSGVAEKFFKDIKELFFPEYEMTSKPMMHGKFHELFLNGISCGYAMALNNADAVKKNSHMFSDINCLIFDEFQSETNRYCSNEVKKFISIHTSIARGQGKQVRYVPVYMMANPVSLINPYYTAMKISNRLKSDTKFLRGNGFVLEQGYNESASKAQTESGFNRAFITDDYVAYSAQATYLNDSNAFIEKPVGECTYVATLRYLGREYAIKEYMDLGIIYCDDRADKTYPYRISITTDDHNVNYVMLKCNDLFLSNMRYFFEHGCFRFKDLQCKEAVLQALSY